MTHEIESFMVPEMETAGDDQGITEVQPKRFVGIFIAGVGMFCFAIWGLGIIEDGLEHNISPIYLMPYICMVGVPILLIFASLLIQSATKTTKNKSLDEGKASKKTFSTAEKWALRICGLVLVVFGIFIMSTNVPLLSELGLFFILVGIVCFMITVFINLKKMQNES